MQRTLIMGLILLLGTSAFAVTSKMTRHASAADLTQGETQHAVVSSEGVLTLARQTRRLDEDPSFEHAWIVNTIVADKRDNLYLGTSPNGQIFHYDGDKLTEIYTAMESNGHSQEEADPNLAGEFTNHHIFAMAVDHRNRLIAGLSGEETKLLRYENKRWKTLYEFEDDLYILAIAPDEHGNIYLGTGPEGKLYSFDPAADQPEVIYDLQDKNILSLLLDGEGYLYAGSDGRGLIYKISLDTGKASVAFDSDQTEITGLALDEKGNLYAAATSARALPGQGRTSAIATSQTSGRPAEKTPEAQPENLPRTLKIAHTQEAAQKTDEEAQQAQRNAQAQAAGRLYQISPRGFVTEIFNDMSVFFALTAMNDNLLLGTGNDGELFLIEPGSEEKTVLYKDVQASQITAAAAIGDTAYIATANPAKFLKIQPSFASQGSYISQLIDAGQPARWGKIQIDADIPDAARVHVTARSGNVKDPNDPTFSGWTHPVPFTGPTELTTPIGRYLQYKLILETDQADATPKIREIAAAHIVPNQPPQISEISVSRHKEKEGVFQISFKAEDANEDTLLYNLEFKRIDYGRWIELKEDLEQTNFEWNSKTVADGRYEIRLTATDKRSNTLDETMTDVRISDPVVVDNTAPALTDTAVTPGEDSARISFTLGDEFTVIGKISYSVNSSDEWIPLLPEDLIYDTRTEHFTATIPDLESGAHVIAFKIQDDLGNTQYRSFEVEID